MSPTPNSPFWYLLGAAAVAVSLFWVWVAWRALRAHERIVTALHGQAGAQKPSFPWGGVGLLLAVVLLWLVFWSMLRMEAAFGVLVLISLLTVIGGQRLLGVEFSLWRIALALLLHCAGSVAFVLERLTRWETSSATNLAYQHPIEWVLWAESYALSWVQASLNQAEGSLRLLDSRVTGEFPDLAGWPLGMLAIVCWIGAGWIAFQRRTAKLLPTSLLWFALFFLPAWLVVERGDIGTGGVSTQSGKPLSPVPFELVEQRLHDQVNKLGEPVLRRAQYEVLDSQSKRIGRLEVYSFEERYPWKRWKFDWLAGPLRTQPRLTYFLLEDELHAPGLLYEGLGQVWRAPIEQFEGWADRQRAVLGLTELR